MALRKFTRYRKLILTFAKRSIALFFCVLINLTTPAGFALVGNQWFQVSAEGTPTVSTITPDTGSTIGGTEVTISGTNFTTTNLGVGNTATNVSLDFDEADSASFDAIDSNQVSFVEGEVKLSTDANGEKALQYNSTSVFQSPENGVQVYDSKTDSLGNTYYFGSFNDATIDFDPTEAEDIRTAYNLDIFLSKYDAAGTYLQTFTWINTYYTYPSSIEIDSSDNVYAFGSYTQALDLDPTSGVDNAPSASSSQNGFISKLNSSGEYQYSYVAASVSTLTSEMILDIAFDGGGNVYLYGYVYTGNATTAIDLDFTGGVNNVTPDNYMLFVSKYDPAGNYVHSRTWTGYVSGYQGSSSQIAIDLDANVYIIGRFSGTIDFNPYAGTDNKTSVSGNNDIFLTKLNSNDSYGYTHIWGTTNNDLAKTVSIDNNGNVFIGGYMA
ncbi:IPT/TIG domain-containing protein, partial [Candidatus Woesebacteria bacterium]|nr:IPT/TIG domain-containing protein [Candidatus Woesebacteria bacterium]